MTADQITEREPNLEPSAQDGLNLVEIVRTRADQTAPGRDASPIPTLPVSRPDQVQAMALFNNDSRVRKIFDDNSDKVLHLTINDGKPDKSTGSGFFVSKDGLIATDYHVIKDSRDEIRIKDGFGREYRATLVDVDVSNDLALLRAKPRYAGEEFPVVKLAASSNAGKDAAMTALGYPLGSAMLHASPGRFNAVQTLDKFQLGADVMPGENPNRPLMTLLMNVRKGNSGGPLFDETDGSVRGIIGFGDKAQGKLGLATPIEPLLALIHKQRPQQAIPPYASPSPVIPWTDILNNRSNGSVFGFDREQMLRDMQRARQRQK